MEILSNNLNYLFFLIPSVFFIGFTFQVLFLAGPKMLKAILKGGDVEIIYTPPDTCYIQQIIVEQPERFKPIKLSNNYFIGIMQPNPDDKGVFRVSVIEESEGKYLIKQDLHIFNGTYSTAKELADLYAKNYGLSTRRIF